MWFIEVGTRGKNKVAEVEAEEEFLVKRQIADNEAEKNCCIFVKCMDFKISDVTISIAK